MALWLVTVVALCFLTRASMAGAIAPHEYHFGDTVLIAKRSQYKGFRTSYAHLMHSFLPSFGVPKTVEFNPLSATQDMYGVAGEFKLQFSLGNDEFPTQWITVVDGQGRHVKFISFEFVHDGTHISQVLCAPVMKDDADQAAGEGAFDSLVIHYEWTQRSDSVSAVSGINVVLFTSFLVATFFFVIALGTSFTGDSKISVR
jgi:hypothetical protein